MSDDIFIPQNIFKKKDKVRKKIPDNIFAGTNKSVPDKIHIYYSSKIDIKRINDIILYKFNVLNKTREEISNKIKLLKTKVKKQKLMSIVSDYENKIKENEKLLKDYSENKTLAKYIKETEKFLNMSSPSIDDCKDYINIASKYINIEILKKNKQIFCCKGCGFDLEKAMEEEENVYICPNCNCFNNFLSPCNYIKDVEYGKSVDEDVSNFSKILDKFEGKNDIEIEEDLIVKLDNFFSYKKYENRKIL